MIEITEVMQGEKVAKNTFGGPWTRKKLEILEKYLSFYSIALKNTSFQLHYADAFAGSGSQSPKIPNEQVELVETDDLLGSVRTALKVKPGFNHYHFNDLNEDFREDLEKIKKEFSEREISVSQLDANDFVRQFCANLKQNDRAVLFLDPFSTELDWKTLGYVAKCKKVDLWMLFPISVILRMTPKSGDRIRPEWKKPLDRLLGTDEWQQALYVPRKAPEIKDLFDDELVNEEMERVNVDELEAWISNRLKEEFPYVAKPVRLKSNKTILFLFYFAVSNPSPKASNLAEKVVTDILKYLN